MKVLAILMLTLLVGPLVVCAAESVSRPAPAPSAEVRALREAITLKQEGDHFQKAESLGEARTKWLAAFAAYERAGYRPGQVEVLFRIGTSYQPEMLDPKKQPLFLDAMMRGLIAAAEHFRDGMAGEEPGDRDAARRGDALFAEGLKLAAAGDCKAAVSLFSQAGGVYRDAGSGKGEASSLAERLRCAAKAPDVFSVLQAMQEVMPLGEKLKPRLRFKPAMRYMQAIDAEAAGKRDEAEKLGRSEEAFRFAEQARARAFLDQLGNQRIEVGRGADADLVRQEGELRARLAHLAASVQKEGAQSVLHEEGVQRLKVALDQARSDYAALLIRLKLANPELASFVSVETLSLHEVQQSLDEGTTLIEYLVPSLPAGSSEGINVLAWVIDREQSSMVKLPVLVNDLQNCVKELRNLIAIRQPIERQAAELYRDLFAPLAPHVRHRNLVIIPHGVLHFLPFSALWDEPNQRYLGDAYVLSYAPSATALKFAREKKARAVGPVVVAGNPDSSLPAAASEARAVARLYGAEPLLGRAVTEGAVMARATQAGILHLATHAELNSTNPLFTRVKLAPDGEHDGNLEMHEVLGLNLSQTSLVVLSACSTQMGTLTGGDELDGLTRAFLYAGTPAVMASLWDVQDESTSFLMERFYTHLREEVGRAEALRLEQMETRRKYPHPYHWAAFVLTGDGR